MTNNKLLIIDGDLLLYKHLHTNQRLLATKSGQLTGLFFGLLKSLHIYINKFAPGGVLLCLSGGDCEWRKEIYKSYKEKSKESIDKWTTPRKGEEFSNDLIMRENLKLINEYYKFFGINPFSVSGHEADDLAFVLTDLCTNNISSEIEVICISDDWDWAQVVEIGAKVYRPTSQDLLTQDNFEKITGFKPEEFIYYKAIKGDKTDNIPAVAKGIGKVRTKKLFEAIKLTSKPITKNSIKEFIKDLNDASFDALLDDWQDYERNIKLMSWDKIPKEEIIKQFKLYTFSNFNEEKAREIIKQLELSDLYNILTNPYFKRL